MEHFTWQEGDGARLFEGRARKLGVNSIGSGTLSDDFYNFLVNAASESSQVWTIHPPLWSFHEIL